jgi:rhodanese-related sulfurtransferase
MPLADYVIVYPAHGAGSACGKNMMKETVDTLGNQKKMNYALRIDMTKEEFVKEVTDGLLPPPAYFPENVRLNKEGYESIDKVMSKGLQALSPEEFEVAANETGALILDTRSAQIFAKGFIPNSINIGIDGSFAPWVGALILGVDQPLLIVAAEGREQEVIARLARVGYDNSIGFLKGGLQAWVDAGKEVDTIESITADEYAKRIKNENVKVIDVRKPTEFSAEHVNGAINLPLDFINEYLAEFPKEERFYMHCASGYRSMVAASILRARGWNNFVEVSGGVKALCEAGIPMTDYICPTTLQK